MSKEKNIKNFTYDYDGSMILILNNEKDKLPPVQHPINFDLRDPEGKGGRSRREVGRKVKATKNKVIEMEKEATKTGNPIPVEEFDLKPGVTLYYMGGSKKGNKPANTIDRLMNPEIRLTKTEYLELTKGGNLSRGNLVTTEREINTAFESVPKEADFLSKVVKTDGFKDLPKVKKKRSEVVNTGSIRVNSYKLVDTLSELTKITKNERTANQRSNKKKDSTKKIDPFLSNEKDMDEIDHFNKNVIMSKEWGKTTFKGNFSKPLLEIHKPSQREIKSSIGIRIKKPRERVIESLRPKSQKFLKNSQAHTLTRTKEFPDQTSFLPEITAINESKEKSFFT